MSWQNDGGSAFPFAATDPSNIHLQASGMSLRDYAAIKFAAAMIGTAAAPCLDGLSGYEETTARAAYRMADAMLAERSKS